MRLRHFSLVILLAVALGPRAANAQATGSFTRSLSAEGLKELDVTTGSGSIEIQGGSGTEIVVMGYIQVRRTRGQDPEAIVREIEADPPIEFDGSKLSIGHRDRWGYRAHVSISYEIQVPAGTEVASDTGSGAQIITGMATDLKVRTGSGHIELKDIAGTVIAETGSGAIRAQRIAGAFSASTGSGSITLAQTAAGDVDVSTGSGRIELNGIVGGLEASTGSGRINVAGRQSARWDLQSGSGTVAITLPADAAFDLDAHASSGRLSISHPVTVQGTLGRNQLRGTVRGGGPLLRVSTGSGDIRIG